MSQTTTCPQCGTVLPDSTRFCSECGYPVQPGYAVGSAPESQDAVPLTQKMNEFPEFVPPASPEPVYDSIPVRRQPARTRPLLVGAGIFLGLCCLGLIGLGLVFAYIGGDGFSISLFSSPTPTATHTPTPTQTPAPTDTPQPTNTPLPETPSIPPTQSAASGPTRLTDTEFFDDFSSTDLDWYQTDDDQSKAGYEAGGYVLQVKQADYRQLARPPLRPLSHIEFNAQVLEGAENGTFGVACYYIDIQNYYYVEFYLPTREYRVGSIQNGEWVDITDWAGFAFASEPLKFGVDCTTTAISVYINDTLMVQTPVDQPEAPGEIWLFTMAWSDSAGGIKTYFDNIYGYISQP